MSTDGRVMAGFTVPAGVTISVTTNSGGPTAVPITAGSYASIVAFLTQLQADLIAGRPVTAGTWAVSISTGPTGTGRVTIAVTAGTYSISWTSTDLRDLLGFAADVAGQVTSTGTKHARGIWQPDATFFCAGRYKAAPPVTDLRQTRSPDGFMFGIVGNLHYSHKGARWSGIPQNRTWIADELVENESLQRFLMDAQWGLGHEWFTSTSKCVIIAHDGNTVGGSIAGWRLDGCAEMNECVRRFDDGWDGNWTFEVAELVSDS